MTFGCHEIPRDLFDALAAGGGGPAAIRALAQARYSKHLILLKGVLAAAPGAGTEQARLARDGYDLLSAVQHHDPAAARNAIQHPSVGPWALRTLRRAGGGPAFPGAEPGRLSAVAAAAAIRSGLPAEIEVPAARGAVLLPALGQAVLDGRETAVVRSGHGSADVRSGRHRVEVPASPYRDAPGWLGLRRIKAGFLDVLVDDLDPFRMPSSTSLSLRLSSVEFGRLDAVLQRAWALLDAGHPAAAAEIAEAVAVVVPLSNERGGQASSSSSAAFGAVALSEPPDPVTCAATLAHEIQHLKLSAVLDIVTLTRPDDGRRYYAPWRDDPRPVAGLLQGAYAFLGVTGFWLRQRTLASRDAALKAHAEFARWRAATTRTIETLLSSGRLTPAGRDFVRGMARTARSWQDEPVPAEAASQARREADRHQAIWQAANGPLPV
jgi:uncharacterized protein